MTSNLSIYKTVHGRLQVASKDGSCRFFEHTCTMHGGLICIAFCPSVCLSVTGPKFRAIPFKKLLAGVSAPL